MRKPGRLVGPEFRFLRTFMGYQSKDLAPIIGASTDRLARLLVVLRKEVEAFAPEQLGAIDKKAGSRLELEMRLKGDEWRPAA